MNHYTLVTGGAGFVGSHLCDKLLERGEKVICIDNLYTGNLDNIKHALTNPNFKFYKLDVADCKPFIVDHYFDDDIKTIYNLACPASPIHYQYDPIYTLMTSVLGAKSVLDLARNYNARVVQASTSEIYGDPLLHPQPETYFGNVNTIGPRSCYDEGKRTAETLFSDYRRIYGLNAGIFRIFNTYGSRMHRNDGRVVSNFIVAALSDGPLTINGDGSQTRSFCYVDDLVDGIIKFADSSEFGPINLGNPEEFTISDLATMIIRKINKGYVVHKEKLEDDPLQRKPVIEKATQLLNWSPKVKLNEGLDFTIDHFRKIIK